MGRLFRGVIRAFAFFLVAMTLFGIGSAVVAAVARRRIETTDDPASNEPTVACVFGGEQFVSRAPALRGGRVITWFAGHDVDLRGATLDPSGATLNLQTLYGGTQIAVPHGWRIRSSVVSIIGRTEIDVDEAGLPGDAPLLELRGFTLFGGARATTSPTASWSGADHEGEALPPALDRSPSAEDVPQAEANEPPALDVHPSAVDAPLPG